MSPIFTKFAFVKPIKLQNYDEQNKIQYLGDIFILMGMLILSAAVSNYLSLGLISLVFNLEFSQVIQMVFDLDNPTHILALKVHNALSAIGTWLFSAWFFLYFKRWNFKNFIKTDVPVFKMDWIYALLIIIGSVFVTSFLIEINGKIPFFQELNEQSKDLSSTRIISKMLEMHVFNDLLINLFFLAIVPAVLEEVFFRGLFQNLLIKSTGNIHIGIAITSLLFAAVHLNPIQFIPMLFLAAMLGYAYHFSGSIWISILIHFLNNGSAVVLNYYQDTNEIAKALVEDNYHPPIYLVIIGLAVCLFILYKMSVRKGEGIYE
ncbi:MAG: CPBP family intramembrane metalloprotease [Bacteroidia bacterium]|nr:CPBP family intramembrane metalloprotease [Bacteroidia bacterium]